MTTSPNRRDQLIGALNRTYERGIPVQIRLDLDSRRQLVRDSHIRDWSPHTSNLSRFQGFRLITDKTLEGCVIVHDETGKRSPDDYPDADEYYANPSCDNRVRVW